MGESSVEKLRRIKAAREAEAERRKQQQALDEPTVLQGPNADTRPSVPFEPFKD